MNLLPSPETIAALVKIGLLVGGLMTAAAYLVLVERWMAAFPNAVFTDVRGINNVGQVAGYTSTDGLVNFPFVLDIASYRRPRGGLPVDRPMQFVSSGRLQNRLKGHDVAIRAFRLASRRCGIPFRYFIAGTGPDHEALRDLCAQLGVTDSVSLLGWVEPADLQALLRNSEVLVHQSQQLHHFDQLMAVL